MPLRTSATEVSGSPAGRQLGLVWGAVAAALVLASPLAPLVAGALPVCPFKSLTGFPCPGCGTTRAALALAAFHPVDAFVHYPLPTLAWIAFLASGFAAAGLALARRPLPSLPRRLPLSVRVGAVAAVLANWGYSILTGV